MLRIRKKLYFKSVCSPQISLSLSPFLPSRIRINLTFTMKGSFTFHTHKKKKKPTENKRPLYNKGIYMSEGFFFINDFLLRRKNLLSGWGFVSIFQFILVTLLLASKIVSMVIAPFISNLKAELQKTFPLGCIQYHLTVSSNLLFRVGIILNTIKLLHSIHDFSFVILKLVKSFGV